jgi:prepilin-type N-terminal cleavage/methylation domain-containing protein
MKSIRKQGFTLIELLVVISIIAILSSIILAALSGARTSAQDAQRIETLHSMQLALAIYADSNNGSYPYTGTGPTWYGPYSCWGLATADYIPGLDPKYISSPLPRDPTDPTPGSADCNQDNFSFLYASNGTDYKLMDFDINDGPTCKALIKANPTLNARGAGNAYGSIVGCGIGYWTPGADSW